ncbi:hypothetical protein [Sediminibacillus halophilus]|uniref:2-dehydro-3-deoxygalactonokinase n=1 Tax=Sediminibacillus halophilus TaxID=482461 RepID=A0A1G9RKC2_9BACI|nr:hypothetical protein [Sediminibacillus halophilus]SDM23673.1 hypothetical protein SAMN05216244_2024 [Sediminibacillus halophilus]
MHSIFIDTGTSNSRIRLLDNRNGKMKDMRKLAAGGKNAAVAGTNQSLKDIPGSLSVDLIRFARHSISC